MTIRSRSLIAISTVLLIGGALLWFFVFCEKDKPPVEQRKTTAEMIVGSWRLVEHPEDRNPVAPPSLEIIYHFAEDGKFEIRVWDAVRGAQVMPGTGTYQLEGTTLKFLNATSDNPSPNPRREIWKLTSTIESLTDDELVIATITRKRWTPEMAQDLAPVQEVPVDKLLNEVREERSREVLMRVKDE